MADYPSIYGDEYNMQRADPYGNLNRSYQSYPTQMGGGSDLSTIMQGLGMMGKTNPWLTAATTFGPPLLGAIGGLFQGESWGDKKAKDVYSMAQNRLGQSVINPDQYLAEYMRANAPRWNQQGEAINRRLNLDSGVAQGELMRVQEPAIAQFMLQAKQQADILKSQRDDSLMSLMAQLTAR